jgi:hypothetical protein
VSTYLQRKDGLFEYTKNLLDDSERERALDRLVRNVPRVSPDLEKFLGLPAKREEAEEHEAAP